MHSHSQSGHDPIWPEFSPCFPHSDLALYQILKQINTRDEQALKHKEMQESRERADDVALELALELGLPREHAKKDTMRKLRASAGHKSTWVNDTPTELKKAHHNWSRKNHPDKMGSTAESHEKYIAMDERLDAFKVWLVDGLTQESYDASSFGSSWTAKGDDAMVQANNSLSVRDRMEKQMHKNMCQADAKRYILEAKTQYYAQRDFYSCFVKKRGLSSTVEKKIQSLEAVLVKCYPNPGFICPSVGASSLVDCDLDLEEHLLGVLLGGRRVS